jgi:cystathionine beta-lyase/cystathionine gamma-synthase
VAVAEEGASPQKDERRPRPRFDPIPPWAGPSTRLIHGARRPDLNAGAVVPPIYQTSTFHFPSSFSESAERGGTYLYTRNENPTTEVAEELMRRLEGGESARLFASGMGALSAALLSLVKPRDEVVAAGGLYGGTTGLVDDLTRFGVGVRNLTDDEAQAPENRLTDSTRLVVIESPTNPLLRVHDLRRWAQEARRVDATLLVDNTFATPINQNPIGLGADLVMHSATKYLGGHSDLLGGVLVGSERLLGRIDAHDRLGATPDPFATFLLTRSLRTLALRVARHNENAARVAEAVAEHPAVARVHYPGWASAEEEEVAARQMRGRGGVLSLSLKGGAPAVERFLRHLTFVHVAASLGGVESLASVPVQTSHVHLDAAARRAVGIDDRLVRLSLGIEETDDLVRDITGALDAADGSSASSPL